ncbi:MAG: TlpA family protein disulfide reductase [Bernardetiaceae bacterium]|jgi:thiol-disulfide isomerase/thioredoxin|nr:TlpA family protein disulfide reductase [Bernardetiaceae bacterium]
MILKSIGLVLVAGVGLLGCRTSSQSAEGSVNQLPPVVASLANTAPETTEGLSSEINYIPSKNNDGSSKSLAQVLKQFSGKVVYIDFWASWCGPCRSEFPFSKELHKKYQTKGIVFLYISLDEDEEDFQSGVDRHQMPGYHFWPTAKEQENLYHQFKLTSIPRYMLVDKQGNVINRDAPRPSRGPELERQLASLL